MTVCEARHSVEVDTVRYTVKSIITRKVQKKEEQTGKTTKQRRTAYGYILSTHFSNAN